MKIAEIERILKAADTDPRIRYYICSLQEQILAQGQHLDQMAALLLQLTSQVGFLVEMSAEQKALVESISGRKGDGLVQSVLPDPTDE